MHLSRLQTINFRSLENIEVEFDGLVNVVIGPKRYWEDNNSRGHSPREGRSRPKNAKRNPTDDDFPWANVTTFAATLIAPRVDA